MKALREARRAHGWTLDRVAEAVGVTRSTVAKWETGETPIRRHQLQAALDAVGATPEQRREAWAEFHGCAPCDLPALLGLVPDDEDVPSDAEDPWDELLGLVPSEDDVAGDGWEVEDLPDADDPWDDEVYDDELDEEVCG